MRTVTALLFCLLFTTGVAAQPQASSKAPTGGVLRVAVATNFTTTLRALAEQYRSATGEQLRISSASTGVHYAQIRQGAPFDVLLAADAARPSRLVADGAALADSQVTYALGRLVLTFPERWRSESLESLLQRSDVTLAIANPELAPYGRAAKAVLERFPSAEPRLLTGQNVGQAAQMWASGGADLALVSASFSLTPSLPVPSEWHPPIEQQAVVLTASRRQQQAQDFLDWLTGPLAREIISCHHYDVPAVMHGGIP